jgi:S-adenosylmethionine/arginine decarboxylase-like enzyme
MRVKNVLNFFFTNFVNHLPQFVRTRGHRFISELQKKFGIEAKENDYVSPPVGNQVSRVFHGGLRAELFDLDYVKEIFTKALEAENFHVCGCVAEKFEPKGYTILFLLSESHFAVHTYIEYNSIYVEIYSCRGVDDGLKTMEIIKNLFAAEEMYLDERIAVPVKAG